MTETQYLVLLGTIWITPHLNKWYAQIMGIIFIGVAVCKRLGWT